MQPRPEIERPKPRNRPIFLLLAPLDRLKILSTDSLDRAQQSHPDAKRRVGLSASVTFPLSNANPITVRVARIPDPDGISPQPGLLKRFRPEVVETALGLTRIIHEFSSRGGRDGLGTRRATEGPGDELEQYVEEA